MATLIAAVDRGYRSVVATDAVTSSNAAAHRAGLDAIFTRYEMQIECADTNTILGNWQP